MGTTTGSSSSSSSSSSTSSSSSSSSSSRRRERRRCLSNLARPAGGCSAPPLGRGGGRGGEDGRGLSLPPSLPPSHLVYLLFSSAWHCCSFPTTTALARGGGARPFLLHPTSRLARSPRRGGREGGREGDRTAFLPRAPAAAVVVVDFDGVHWEYQGGDIAWFL
jgi:hypothetical protein